MRFITIWIILIMLLAFFAIGKAIYREDNTIDIYNYTSKNVNWNSTLYNEKYSGDTFNLSMKESEISRHRLVNIIYKGIDTIGYITFEVAKWGIEVGFRNPDWNYLFFIKIIIFLILMIILLTLLPVLPLLIALTYLLYVGIKILFIKIKTRFDKKCNAP